MKKSFLFIIILSFNSFLAAQDQEFTMIPFNRQAASLLQASVSGNFNADSLSNMTIQEEFAKGNLKSPGKAFLYSLILPGCGEYYLGYKNRAALFLGIEILAWTGYIANDLYAGHMEHEYKTFAVQHARVNRSGKDIQYWIDIGKFDDIYAFNDQRERDRYFDRIYSNTDFYYWSWDSRENRFIYDKKRLDAGELKNRDVYFMGVLLLNRMVSAIHSMAMARKYNRKIKEGMSWNIHFDSYNFSDNFSYFGVNLTAKF
ncbi:MAG: hypothetical protein JXR46_09065 [Calditrichaceae bacterium]|nr:hypothetical protein [Calditrichaceae bacterium]MBN2709182.1 hypothetical protein [Calditrichaceae bacterium]RQV96138.1 MAG: hypothetical protein EH224_05375 [Calditrichota bacterium]